jgi:hypothetical protein
MTSYKNKAEMVTALKGMYPDRTELPCRYLQEGTYREKETDRPFPLSTDESLKESKYRWLQKKVLYEFMKDFADENPDSQLPVLAKLLKEDNQAKGLDHRIIWTTPYESWQQPMEKVWAQDKDYVHRTPFDGRREIKGMRDRARQGFYGNSALPPSSLRVTHPHEAIDVHKLYLWTLKKFNQWIKEDYDTNNGCLTGSVEDGLVFVQGREGHDEALAHFRALDACEFTPAEEEDVQRLVRDEDQDGEDENQDELQDDTGSGTLHALADAMGPAPPPSTSSAWSVEDGKENEEEDEENEEEEEWSTDEDSPDSKHGASSDMRCKVCTLLIQPPMFRCTGCQDLYHQDCLQDAPDLFAIGWVCNKCPPPPGIQPSAPPPSTALSSDPERPSSTPAAPVSSPPLTRHKKKQKQRQGDTAT